MKSKPDIIIVGTAPIGHALTQVIMEKHGVPAIIVDQSVPEKPDPFCNRKELRITRLPELERPFTPPPSRADRRRAERSNRKR